MHAILQATLHLTYAGGPWHPTWPGEHLHGLLFHLGRDLDPQATTALHEEPQRPFRLAVQLGPPAAPPNGRTPATLTATFTALAEPALTVAQALPRAAGATVAVGTATYRLDRVDLGEPVPYTTLAAGGPAPASFTLAFRTPTSFRSQGVQIVFPLPDLVFGSLLRRWNLWAPVAYPEDLAAEFAAIRVSRYRLETRLAAMRGFKVVGCVGWAAYELPPGWPEELAHVAGALLRFAPYAGVGYGTPKGLGEVGVGPLTPP